MKRVNIQRHMDDPQDYSDGEMIDVDERSEVEKKALGP